MTSSNGEVVRFTTWLYEYLQRGVTTETPPRLNPPFKGGEGSYNLVSRCESVTATNSINYLNCF